MRQSEQDGFVSGTRFPKHLSEKGFTLLELLTVTAIAAILLAMVFPVFKAAKQNIKKTGCIANLHTIASALQQYRLDNNRYPTCLLGYYTQDQPMESCKFSLYPEYVRSIEDFTCPLVGAANADDEVIADVPASVTGRYLPPPCQPPGGGGRSVHYYRGDTYSWTDFTGTTNLLTTYLLSWATDQGSVGNYTLCDLPVSTDKDLRDFGRQLRFKTPDSTTVVTWCANHRMANDTVLVLFLDGSVKTIAPDKMNPAVGSPNGNMLWRVLP